jgi:hypothetical protein
MPTSQTTAGVPASRFKNGTRVSDSSGNIYLTIDFVLRKVPDVPTFTRLFRDWDAPEVPALGYTGPPIPTDASLKGNGGFVYLVMGGESRWVVDPATMDLYHFNWPSDKISDEDLKKLTQRRPLHLDFPQDGVAVIGAGGDVASSPLYMSLDGALHDITRAIRDNVYFSRDGWMHIESLGPDVTFAGPMPWDTTLRKYPDKDNIYLVIGGERRWIVSRAVFDDRNFSWQQIKQFDSPDQTVPGPNIGNSIS